LKPSSLDLAGAIVGVLAASLWLGGLLVLGALVAPIVFGSVPAPMSGDTMTVVFRRFDEVSLACAAIVGVAEAVRARAGGVGRADIARIVFAVIAVGCTLVIAVSISPAIASLHAAGAVRGVGPLGEQLDRTHDWATRIAKVEALAIALVIALHVASRRSRDAGKSQTTAD
jgi:uncharacterized membrane protein